MNQLLVNTINKQIAKSLSENSSKISSSIFSGVPENASIEEMLPIMLKNTMQVSISSSVCTILELLESMDIVNLQDDEDVLRRKLLTLLED
ncbi:MAG: hypothetical protein ACI4FZ_08900 [Lachnospiraceae bacterium]